MACSSSGKAMCEIQGGEIRMNKKAVICVAIAAFFIGLAIGLNIGSIFEFPTIANVGCLVVGCFFAGLAVNFNQKDKTNR